MNQSLYRSPFGALQIISLDEKIASIIFCKNLEIGRETIEDSAITKAKKWLDAYFEKEIRAADFPLVALTPIQRLLLKIPFGERRSYKEIALKLNTCPRNAGRLVAQNRLAIIIPCHRVVRSDGSLGGFAWGETTKKALLAHEQESV